MLAFESSFGTMSHIKKSPYASFLVPRGVLLKWGLDII